MSTMQQPQTRPRSKSTFSFKSDKSHSSIRQPKEPLRESAEEKRKSHLTSTTKANPNAAMNEAQPIAAALEKPTLQSLRSFQHKDVDGQIIQEPDLSNPTRSRWERPLDTIRSFEAAIDNEYRRRAQPMRPESTVDAMSGYGSRRSSYYGVTDSLPGYDQNRYSQVGGYYGSRQAAAARESWAENGYGHPRSRYNQQRMQSDPGWNRYGNNGHNVYPTQGYQQSRDTVNTGGSTGSQSEPYSTDPSSDNSSIERATPVTKPDLGEQYGFSGFGGGPQFQGPILEEYGNGSGPEYGRSQENGDASNGGYFQQYNGNSIPPPVPAKAGPPPPSKSNAIRLNGAPGQTPSGGNAGPNVPSRNNTEKRKSWFKRRFSKE
ncbi:hypothetical protein K469DRAFT_771322 [Zopfia rhizophila CBS 207.26]|uniref:DUF2406 domain-containing protein n=1 Tax=Zopfia rhizophila CBS 207.26 TaxID=1314779 RepID=A0A6A6E7M4_9PEZI|nr:hypothetical protein K469DRAFT_771322 [Zopfia rhizophila CBS 207.26]